MAPSLAEFDFTVTYRKGPQNTQVNALYLLVTITEDLLRPDAVEILCFTVNTEKVGDVAHEEDSDPP